MTASQPRTIVAVTGEDGRYARVRTRAGALAATARGTVLLYDIDAAGLLSSPTATEWSGEGQERFDRDRLGPDELEAHGRGAVADQVRALRSVGVDAYGFLPSSPDGANLARYAEAQGADVILVPAEMEEPGVVDRLTGADASRTEDATSIPVVPVEG